MTHAFQSFNEKFALFYSPLSFVNVHFRNHFLFWGIGVWKWGVHACAIQILLFSCIRSVCLQDIADIVEITRKLHSLQFLTLWHYYGVTCHKRFLRTSSWRFSPGVLDVQLQASTAGARRFRHTTYLHSPASRELSWPRPPSPPLLIRGWGEGEGEVGPEGTRSRGHWMVGL